jgi:NAD(P)-dependent dehydrogenase (short-subunit alcohol dehydrogenase family)
MGFYSATKHAIEGYGESLDHEIRQFGVRALLVEPGYMKTNLDHNAARASHALAVYDEARERVGGGINAGIEHGDAPELVAKTVLTAVTAREPRLRYPVGRNASLLSKLRSFLPAGMFDRSLRKEMLVD